MRTRTYISIAFAFAGLFGQGVVTTPVPTVREVAKASAPLSGQTLTWSRKNQQVQTSNLTYSEGSLYFIEKDDLISLEAGSGKARWSYALTNAIDSNRLTGHPVRYHGPTFHKNRLYISDQNYNLHAVDTETGKCIWKVTLEAMFQGFKTPEVTMPAFGNDHLYVGTAGVRAGRCGKVYCIREDDGKVLWEHDADMTIQGQPILLGNVLVTGGGSKKIGLDQDTGRLLWKYGMFKRSAGIHGTSQAWGSKLLFLTSNVIESQPDPLSGPIGSSGARSLPGQIFGFIVCLDATTGKELWEFDSGYPGDLQLEHGAAVAPDVTSFFGITRHRLVVVDIESGKERFKVDNPNKWTPALFNNRMFVATTPQKSQIFNCGTSAGVIAIYSLEDGRILQKYCRSNPLILPPFIAGDSVMLVFWNEKDKQTTVVAIDSETAKEQWAISTDEQITGLPVTGKEGLFFPGKESVFCIR